MKTIHINTPFNPVDAWRMKYVAPLVKNSPDHALAIKCREVGSHHLLSENTIRSLTPSTATLANAEIDYLRGIAEHAAFHEVGVRINQDNPFHVFPEVKESLRVSVSANGSFYCSFIFQPKS